MIVDNDYQGYDMEKCGRKIVPASARPSYPRRKWKWPDHLRCLRHRAQNERHNEGKECWWCRKEAEIAKSYHIAWKTADGSH